jgi:hypothetical protein
MLKHCQFLLNSEFEYTGKYAKFLQGVRITEKPEILSHEHNLVKKSP